MGPQPAALPGTGVSGTAGRGERPVRRLEVAPLPVLSGAGAGERALEERRRRCGDGSEALLSAEDGRDASLGAG